jgi:hypothetical protein
MGEQLSQEARPAQPLVVQGISLVVVGETAPFVEKQNCRRPLVLVVRGLRELPFSSPARD